MAKTGAAMAMFVLLGLVVAVAEGAKDAAPAPASGCDSTMVSMSACLSYVQNGSKEAKPEAECCKGLKTVLKQSPLCLCEVLKESGSLGIVLNSTRAFALPAACKLAAPPSVKECAGSETPPSSPSPKASPSPKTAPSPKSSSPSSPPSASITQSPAPSPSQSGVHVVSVSSFVLCAAMGLLFAFYH